MKKAGKGNLPSGFKKIGIKAMKNTKSAQSRQNLLVALMNNRKDWRIACEEHWYRIPQKTAPQIIRDREAEYIAFYHTKVFEEQRYSIRSYAKIKAITLVSRQELFPLEMPNDKSDKIYFKITFEPLISLPQPIVSRRASARRLLFVPTSLVKLLNSHEINDIFAESPLEETVWTALKDAHIEAERQWYESLQDYAFYLDFAIFCKDRNIGVECDGDSYHTTKDQVQKDKRRDNILESHGWHILRYTTEDITTKLANVILQISAATQHYGGVENVEQPGTFRYISTDNVPEIRLFP